MANRFTDTEKWNDPWFCGLTPQDKLFWLYLCDNCNHAGLWKVNWPLTKFHIGDYDFKKEVFNGRIEYLTEETWFIKKFVLFQQKISDLKELNPLNKHHQSIINLLSSKGITSPLEAPAKGLSRGYGIGIGKGNKEGIVKGGFHPPSVEETTKYCLERKNAVDPNKWHSWYTANGWKVGKNPMKDWKAAVRTWEKEKSSAPNWNNPEGKL